MGKFIAAVQQIIQTKLDKKIPRPDAFRQSRKAVHRAIADWEDQIEKILLRFDGNPPGEYQAFIGEIEAGIGREREFLRDLEEVEASGWATG